MRRWHRLLAGAAFCAGVVNSIAGGGTLLNFPALLAFGVAPIAANATSTLALVPGSAGAAWGYRAEVRSDVRLVATLAIPSVLGGVAGALIVVRLGDALFARLVPWLILGRDSAVPVSKHSVALASRSAAPASPQYALIATFQLVVAIYGGFFGAGIGILMLAALGLAGLRDLHRMNGLKNIAAVACNGVAALTFIANRQVVWLPAAVMAAGAVTGGLTGARLAKRVGQTIVRKLRGYSSAFPSPQPCFGANSTARTLDVPLTSCHRVIQGDSS